MGPPLPISHTRLMLNVAYRLARRIAISVVGFTVLAIGIAMIALPGPAFIVIPIGLGILGLEFAWARRWLKTAKEKAEAVARTVTKSGSEPTPPNATDVQLKPDAHRRRRCAVGFGLTGTAGLPAASHAPAIIAAEAAIDSFESALEHGAIGLEECGVIGVVVLVAAADRVQVRLENRRHQLRPLQYRHRR